MLNVAGAEVVSRYEFACLVAGAAGLSTDRIRRTSIAESGLTRPRNCTLDERDAPPGCCARALRGRARAAGHRADRPELRRRSVRMC